MRKIEYKDVKKIVEDRGYRLNSKDYINSKAKLDLTCDKGHDFKMSLQLLKKGCSCKACSIESRANKRKLSYSFVKETVENRNYKLISQEYQNNESKLEMICDRGHHISMTFGNFQRGHECIICANEESHIQQRNSYKYVKEVIEGIGYTLVSKNYINNTQKLKMICEKGHSFEMSFKSINKGSKCPKCIVYKGEEKISKFLDSLNIDFIQEYRKEDCRFKNTLPFDFYLSDYNILIEYDGKQHFKPVERFGGLDGFIDTRIRDTIKNIYCKENNIDLIRIPYWEFDNIEEILSRKLSLK